MSNARSTESQGNQNRHRRLKDILSELNAEQLKWPIAWGFVAAALSLLLILLAQFTTEAGDPDSWLAAPFTAILTMLEIVGNCGLFAPAIAFFTVGGFVYLVGLRKTNIIPSPKTISKESARLEDIFAELAERYEQRAETLSNSGVGPKQDSTSGDNLGNKHAAEGGHRNNDNQHSAASATGHIGSTESDPPPVSAATPHSAMLGQADEIAATVDSRKEEAQQAGGSEAAVDKTILNGILNRLAGHPWLRERLSKVLISLALQGPEAARTDNQILAEQEESNVAVRLIPAQVCEWILPLLGFLGTVWGLHHAIGPLSTGVRQMMDLVRSGETVSNVVMEHFGDGFIGLRTAFDTTLLGLLGAVFVGLTLFWVRRQAMKSLSRVYAVTDDAIRQFPIHIEPLREHLVSILRTLQDGLIIDEKGTLRPRLELLREAVSRGLLHVPEGTTEPQPWLRTATEQISDSATRAGANIAETVKRTESALQHGIQSGAGTLGAIQLDLLRQSRLRTALQLRAIAPDLHEIRNKICETDREKAEILPPAIGILFELPESYEVEALAVANNASRACVGGLNKGVNLNFIQDKSIEWDQEAYSLSPGIRFEGHTSARTDNYDGQQSEVDARVLGVSYDSEARRIFALCLGGTCYLFTTDQMRQFQLPRGIPAYPFIWHPSYSHSPFVAFWERHEQEHRFQLVLATDTSHRLGFDTQMESLLERLRRANGPPDHSGRLAVKVDKQLLCIGGKDCLAVARFAEGDRLDLISCLDTEYEIIALDLSARNRFVLFASADGDLFQWHFESESQAKRVIPTSSHDRISGVYLNADGDMIALLSGSEIKLFEIDNYDKPKLFSTGGLTVTQVAQSHDRQSLLVATKENIVSLFSFSLRL